MTIPRACKRLAEVDFPIAEVGRAVVTREKRFPVPRGLPSTMHQWWARRPLGSSRAMLIALLLPDPCDPACLPAFKEDARRALLAFRARPSGWDALVKDDEGLRRAILAFIADFSNWDNAGKDDYLTTGRALVKAAHPDEKPLVVDPFAGGGSIPLEALRIGCDTFASDLNPVACLILKTLLEDIPRGGRGLADELRRVGAKINAKAKEELVALYPKDADGVTPIAYLWARTVRCESPNCGAEIPLMRSLWLCNKPNRKFALRPMVIRPAGASPRVEFEIFTPASAGAVGGGTVARANATCLCCGTVLPAPRVRVQLAAQRGGADTVFDEYGNRLGGARLTAVVTLREGKTGRHYRLATETDYAAVREAQARVATVLDEWERGGRQGLCPVPDEPTPEGGGSGAGRAFSLHRYGMLEWGDLFTARQKISIIETIRQIKNARSNPDLEILRLTALVLGKITDFNCSLSSWRAGEDVRNVFARQALPMVWDFVETHPCGDAYMGISRSLNHVAEVVERVAASITMLGMNSQQDAAAHPLLNESAAVWFTDPPYYDAVPYADLADFFLVWLKRLLPDDMHRPDPFDPSNMLAPKVREIVQDEKKKANGSIKGRAWFEDAMAKAFEEGRRVARPDGVASVIFAHKTTEGWEALLSGVIRGGWTITGSWPIATEMGSRLRARDSAALATSVHLVCRPRLEGAPVGEWGEVLRELPGRVGDWMQRLQEEGVRGADLVFACVGPALEIYSRHSRVETPDGRVVELREYLERVWEVVGREALQQVLGSSEAQARNGGAGALEEDARLTALFLWTMQSTGDAPAEDADGEGGADDDADEEDGTQSGRRPAGFSLPFDIVRRFAQPLGIDLPSWESRVVKTEKGVVRLLPVLERGRQLFGEQGAQAAADEIESSRGGPAQLTLFPDEAPAVRGRGRRRPSTVAPEGDDPSTAHAATTLDRVHAAMILQATGRSAALRNLLRTEQERGPDFLRLANALTALYPRVSEEKRLLDAMLLAAPR